MKTVIGPRDPRTKTSWSRTERFGSDPTPKPILKISDRFGGPWIPDQTEIWDFPLNLKYPKVHMILWLFKYDEKSLTWYLGWILGHFKSSEKLLESTLFMVSTISSENIFNLKIKKKNEIFENQPRYISNENFWFRIR